MGSQDCFSPGGGSAVEHQHHVPYLRGQGGVWGWMCPPEELKNCIFETQFARFGTYLLATFYWKKSFKVNYWIHYHVWRSSHLYCFDAFVRTFINLWKFKKRVSEGEFPLRSFWGGSSPFRIWKKLQFSNSIRCIPFAKLLLKPLFIFNKILVIFSIPPTFLVLMLLLGIINFWPLKKWGCLRGNFPSEAEKLITKKKCNF